jgi:uncharacterized membrane protein YwzB
MCVCACARACHFSVVSIHNAFHMEKCKCTSILACLVKYSLLLFSVVSLFVVGLFHYSKALSFRNVNRQGGRGCK